MTLVDAIEKEIILRTELARISQAISIAILVLQSVGVAQGQECSIDPVHFESLEYSKNRFEFKLSLEFIAKVDVSLGQTQAGRVSSELQMMERSLLTLLDARNTCQITEEEFTKYLNKFYDYEKEALTLAESLKKIDENSKKLGLYEEETAERDAAIKQMVSEIKTLDRKYDLLINAQKDFSDELAKLPEVIRNRLLGDEEFYVFVSDIAKTAVSSFDGRLAVLEVELKKIEENQKSILVWMKKHSEGELKEAHWVVGVTGSSLNIDDNYEFGKYLDVGIHLYSEFLLPNKEYPTLAKFIPFVETGYVSWARNKSYGTLPNGPRYEYEEENGFYYYNVGMRKYFDWKFSVSGFVGITVGGTNEIDASGSSSWSYGALAGVAYYPIESRFKISVEFRYSKYSLSEETRVFDPYGDLDSILEDKEYRVPSLALSLGMAF